MNIEIINENEMPKIRSKNKYYAFHKALDTLPSGKGLKIPKNSLGVKNPVAAINAIVYRHGKHKIITSQDDDYIYVKKLE